MRLSRLSMYNFMPYKGPHEVKFPVEGRRGIVVIYGDNMRGKTSFLNAIRWAFFGRAIARHGRNVPFKDLVNIDAVTSADDWNMWVEVVFEARGAEYTLRRSLARASAVAHPVRNQDFDVKVRFTKDSERLNSQETQDEINQLFPEQISRFFLFDGELLEDYETLVREPSPAQGIKAAIERVLGVPALINGRAELGLLLEQAQAAQAQDLRHVKSMRSQAEQQLRLQAEMRELAAKLNLHRERKADAEKEIGGIDEELEKLAEQAERLEEYTYLKSKRKDLSIRIDAQGERRASLLQEVWRDLLQPQLEPSIASLRAEQQSLLNGFGDNAKAAAEAAFLERAYLDAHCEICDQDVQRPKKAKLARRLGELEGRLRTNALDVERLSTVSAQLERLARIVGLNMIPAVTAAEREIENLQVQQVEVRNRLHQLEQEIDSDAHNELLRLTNRRVPLEVEVGKLDQEIAQLQSRMEEKSSKQAQIARLLARNPDARRQRSSALVDKYGALQRIFASSVEGLRARQRDRVAHLASEAFTRLTTETGFRNLTINENYGLSILDEAGRPVAERSAGAEQVVALSLIDGLNKVARRYDPIVMDTPFGRLDLRHRSKVLSYLPDMAEQVILLVHEGEMDPERDLQLIKEYVSARYSIERVSTRQSRLKEVPLP